MANHTQSTAAHPNFELVRRSVFNPDYHLVRYMGCDMFALAFIEPHGGVPNVLADGYAESPGGAVQVFVVQDDGLGELPDGFEEQVEILTAEDAELVSSAVKAGRI